MAFSPPNAKCTKCADHNDTKGYNSTHCAMQPAKDHIPNEPTTAKLASNTPTEEQDKESTPRGTHLQTTDNRHSTPTPSTGYRIRTTYASISTTPLSTAAPTHNKPTNQPIKKAKVMRTTNSNQILSPRALVIVRATTALKIAYHEQHPRPFEVNVAQSFSITNWHARV